MYSLIVWDDTACGDTPLFLLWHLLAANVHTPQPEHGHSMSGSKGGRARNMDHIPSNMSLMAILVPCIESYRLGSDRRPGHRRSHSVAGELFANKLDGHARPSRYPHWKLGGFFLTTLQVLPLWPLQSRWSMHEPCCLQKSTCRCT